MHRLLKGLFRDGLFHGSRSLEKTTLQETLQESRRPWPRPTIIPRLLDGGFPSPFFAGNENAAKFQSLCLSLSQSVSQSARAEFERALSGEIIARSSSLSHSRARSLRMAGTAERGRGLRRLSRRPRREYEVQAGQSIAPRLSFAFKARRRSFSPCLRCIGFPSAALHSSRSLSFFDKFCRTVFRFFYYHLFNNVLLLIAKILLLEMKLHRPRTWYLWW